VIVDLDGGRIKREVCMETVWKLLTIHRKTDCSTKLAYRKEWAHPVLVSVEMRRGQKDLINWKGAAFSKP
jgi:hypothetical protein